MGHTFQIKPDHPKKKQALDLEMFTVYRNIVCIYAAMLLFIFLVEFSTFITRVTVQIANISGRNAL